MSFVEPLEARIAPAAVINPTTLSYVDQDGDMVTVKFSLPLLKSTPSMTSTTIAEGIFTFSTPFTDATAQQLELIQLGGSASGTSISVTVKQAGHGDGYAAVGYIDAACPLGAVTIYGDLGGIDTGLTGVTAKTPAGLKSLAVLSMGAYGLTTQEAMSGMYTPSLGSTIEGPLGSLVVKTDIFDAGIGAKSIGSIKIGGSLIGGSVAESGSIGAKESIGSISIGGNLTGGTGNSSGDITAGGSIGSIKIGGSLIGGTGTGTPSSTEFSGYISSVGTIGVVSIGQNIVAGDFEESGKLQCGGAMTSLTVGGSIIGGAGAEDTGASATQGQIAVATNLGSLKVGGDITGGTGEESAALIVHGKLGNVTVGGSLTGGAANLSGEIVGLGQIGALTIAGSIIGGGSAIPTGDATAGEIYSNGSIGAVKVGGSIVGGASGDSGEIEGDTIASVLVGGSVIGGSEPAAGEIYAFGKCGTVTVMHSLIGGSSTDTGVILSDGVAGAITVNGSIQGGSGTESGVVDIEDGTPSVFVGGSIVAGTGPTSGGITSDYLIGSVVVKGSVVGTTAEHAFIDSIGLIPSGTKSPKTDLAIKSITIGGDFAYGDILAGQDADYLGVTAMQNGSAQLGSIKIGGNFIGSNIAAGVGATGEDYGKNYDVFYSSEMDGILSGIASVTIGGQAIGTAVSDTTGDTYGIIALKIGSVKIGGSKMPLVLGSGVSADVVPLGIAGGLDLIDLSLLS